MTLTYFIKMGVKTMVVSGETAQITTKLDPQVYQVEKNPLSNELSLMSIGEFTVPEKIYGDVTAVAERIYAAFKDRPSSTGVMLSGEKGSGKTMIAKILSGIAKAEGLPTIVVDSEMSGSNFNSFMQTIDTPCVVIFDEFEKIYDEEHQQEILTLLDGVFNTKKLFVLTTNDISRVDDNLINRPGRIFYSLKFRGLDEGFIREYLAQNLKDQTQVEEFIKFSITFSEFNFDMMQALVEEMNRFGVTVKNASRFVNATPGFRDSKFEILSIVDANGMPLKYNQHQVIEADPFNEKFPVFIYDEKDSRYVIYVVPSDYAGFSADRGLVFKFNPRRDNVEHVIGPITLTIRKAKFSIADVY